MSMFVVSIRGFEQLIDQTQTPFMATGVPVVSTSLFRRAGTLHSLAMQQTRGEGSRWGKLPGTGHLQL